MLRKKASLPFCIAVLVRSEDREMLARSLEARMKKGIEKHNNGITSSSIPESGEKEEHTGQKKTIIFASLQRKEEKSEWKQQTKKELKSNGSAVQTRAGLGQADVEDRDDD